MHKKEGQISQRALKQRKPRNVMPDIKLIILTALHVRMKVQNMIYFPLTFCLSTAQHSTAQHSTSHHSAAQHSTAQHSTYQENARNVHERQVDKNRGSLPK